MLGVLYADNLMRADAFSQEDFTLLRSSPHKQEWRWRIAWCVKNYRARKWNDPICGATCLRKWWI